MNRYSAGGLLAAMTGDRTVRSTVVAAVHCPLAWALARFTGASSLVPPDHVNAGVVANAHTLVMILPEKESESGLSAFLCEVRRLGYTGYVIALAAGLGRPGTNPHVDDPSVDVMELPASLADMHAKLWAGRGRRLSPEAAAAAQARSDDDGLRKFLRNNLGHGSFASVRRAFTQAQHALRVDDKGSADRHLENCRHSCQRAIDSLASEAKRFSVRTDTRRVLEEMKTAFEETNVLLERLRSGVNPEAAVSRIEVLIDSVQATIDTVAPKKGDV